MVNVRGDELNKLNSFFERKESSLVVLYGEHLSGVSSLWQEFAEEKDSVYLKASYASLREQSYLWAKRFGHFFNSEELYSMDSALEAALLSGEETSETFSVFTPGEDTAVEKENKKKLIVISDFSLTAESDDAFLRTLFVFLSRHRQKNDVMILLVTEKVFWAENRLLDMLRSENLHPDGFVRVYPLHFIDLVCAMNSQDFDELMNVYAIFGGYSESYDYLNPALSLKENIINTFLDPDAPFCGYGTEILKNSFREPAVYATILASLAEGRNKLNDLYLHTGFSRAKLSVYLKNLADISLTEKVKSYDTPGAENTKKGVYRIYNPIVKFYFTFLYPREAELETMDAEEFYDTYIADEIESYCMKTFPVVCEEFLNLANERELLPIAFIRYGEWVGKSGTIDFIAQDKERNFLFGFCNPKRGELAYKDVLKMISLSEDTHLTPDYFCFFSLDGFDEHVLEEMEDKENVYLFDRTDLC